MFLVVVPFCFVFHHCHLVMKTSLTSSKLLHVVVLFLSTSLTSDSVMESRGRLGPGWELRPSFRAKYN